MAENKHILDDLVERINKKTGEEITVYLARYSFLILVNYYFKN